MNTKSICLPLATLGVVLFTHCATPPAPKVLKGVPLRKEWAAILAMASQGPLKERAREMGEIEPEPRLYALGARGATAPSEVFKGYYREQAKTSFTRGRTERVRDIDSILTRLPNDAEMKRQYPDLAKKATQKHPNLSERTSLENRNVRVKAWIYWTGKETDKDYHVILGDTPELTSETKFMNSEVSGLPKDDPTNTTFVARRDDIRSILTSHKNRNGLFDGPVPVVISGPLLWDGEHTYPNTVGPKALPAPPTAWEIHPIHTITVN